jgi:hypothetical protein
VATDHAEKAALFWNEFKHGMGVSVQPTMLFNLQQLLWQEDLQELEEPFPNAEIDEVVRCLPIDKAPRPDGFNEHFVKRAWPLIKYDFYRLCSAFFNHEADLMSINCSYITLVPKKPNSEKVSDYRSISLLKYEVAYKDPGK